ncbi:histidine phosphatase family protein [uncultured Anaerococcus sp.]|uniref:histidine phosphatase family protein n=1 Tax=uncultured Anaerococcus sp. TaxID=293428 RepID=UPI002607C2EF|nr:histidine phosphatase family protein [uncultured Anaerococcus sp.]
MKIILVRHGLSEANIGRFYSMNDTILHENGYDVLEKTKKNLEKYTIDHVYTSKLLRSQQTAEKLGFDEYTIDSRLNELDFGNFKGKLFEETRKKEAQFFVEQEKDVHNVRYPEGESRADVIKRISEFLDELVRKNENALCVSHGIAIKSSLFWILKDLGDWDSFWLENGSITVFNIENGKKLVEAVNIL